jgi:hypothetical protein
MFIYRLFILDDHENFVSGVDLGSDCDDEALEWTAYVLPSQRIGELWCGTRCVGRINHVRTSQELLVNPHLLSTHRATGALTA